jgi:TusA-related sulfurtransferase
MIDARGQSCPIPVVMVQNAVKKNHPDELQVQVDSMVCVENISRYAASQGYAVAVAEDRGEFTLTLKK